MAIFIQTFVNYLILNLARLSIYIYLENVHLAHNLEFAGVNLLLLSEILTQKWFDVNLNYSIILAQMWPNLARTGLQKYAACRQWSLSCHCSAKMIA